MLGLQRHSPPSWYRDRLREELQERRQANTLLQKLSETSDVFFTMIRAQHDGYPVRKIPEFATIRHLPVYLYMIVKYTSRWAFYRAVTCFCRDGTGKSIQEVVNPGRDRNLREVASRNGMDPERFERVGRRLRKVWPLLP